MAKSYELEFIAAEQKYTLLEVCQRIQLEQDFVIQCVDFGITNTGTQQTQELLFSTLDILKLKKAYRLQRDLDINFPSIGIILELLEDVDNLRAEVEHLQLKLQQWEMPKT